MSAKHTVKYVRLRAAQIVKCLIKFFFVFLCIMIIDLEIFQFYVPILMLDNTPPENRSSRLIMTPK